jgi:glycerophosphoryl diester phosphodiesterase
MRTALPLVAFSLLAAACGGGTDTAAETTSAPTPTEAPATTVATTQAPTTTATPTTTAAPVTTTTLPIMPEVSTVADLIALDRPVIAAHAGGDQEHPHSTPYGYRESALAGVDVLEMDVQLTADGVLIIQHDDTVDGTTPSSGEIRAMTYAEIAALDNAWWHVPGCWPCRDEADSAYVWRGIRTGDAEPPAGYTADDFRVVTFTEIATRYPGHVLDIEIKIQRGDDGEQDTDLGIEAATELARLIDELDRTESVIVTSFNDDVLAAFRELAPDVVTSPGLNALSNWFLAGGELHPNDRILQVPPTYGDIQVMSLDLTARAHAEGYEVWVWPNGREEENVEFYDAMVEMGADGIIAGAPVAAATHWSGS